MPEAEAGLITPAEPEVPAVAQQPATPEVTEPVKPERTFSQKELDEILEKRLAKERRRYSQAQRRIGELSATQPPKEAGKPDAPKRDAFDSYEDYLEAKAAYAAEQAATKKFNEQNEQNKKFREDETQRERVETWGRRQELGRKKYTDFDDVVGSEEVKITRHMAEAIMESDLGHEVAYFLGKNHEEAERIADLSPVRQQVEIGKLEAKLSETPKPKASQTPAPITPVKGGGVSDSGLSDDLSTAEWIKRRQKQVRGKT